MTAVTDASGKAMFRDVPVGEYTAGPEKGLPFYSNVVTVHADGDVEEEITIEWPLQTLSVRTLRGKLITPGEEADADLPLHGASVKLLDLRSSRVLETQPTIADGSYEFSSTEPGLYVVRIIPPAQGKKAKLQSRDLAVELDPAAKESTIPEMRVLRSECAGVQLLQRIAKNRWEAP